MGFIQLSPWRSCAISLTLLSFLILPSCTSVAYFQQAALGQLSLLVERESIEELLADEALDDNLRESFQVVLDIRHFAETELNLSVDASYTSYVALEHDYVAWNVFAAEEFSVDAITWCFPIAGCIAYRGYFDESKAQDYAQSLQDDSLEVYVGGVSAYSTLGWFNDPVLSSMLRSSDTQLAATLIHEIAHRTVYASGDSTFNESFATFVEREGVRRWLAYQGLSDRMEEFDEAHKRRSDFSGLILAARDRLRRVYQGGDEDKSRTEKEVIKNLLRADYAKLKESWGGFTGYDKWFDGPLNNAQLSTVATYNELSSEFACLFDHHREDLAAFLDEIRVLAAHKGLASAQLSRRVQELHCVV